MDEEPAPDAAPVTTAPDSVAGHPSPAASADRPDSLSQALGEDGPGIAAEIESELGGAPADPDPGPPAATGLEGRLGILADLDVTLSARLCATTQPLGSVLSMKPGTIVDLGRGADAPIELLANGVVVAYGEVVAVGSSLGVRVTALASSK